MNSYLLAILLVLHPLSTLSLRSVSNQLPPFYSETGYQTELLSRQTQLQDSISNLEQQLGEIDKKLQDVDTATTSKIVILEEGMAEQRDSLFNIQQSLNLPFSMKKCECKTLSEEEKLNIQNQIGLIVSSVETLQADLQKCSENDCPKYEQLAEEIKSLKQYAFQIKKVVYSDCCRQRFQFKNQSALGMANLNSSLFKDNLEASNWYYGTTNEDQYRLKMFELTTKFNLRNCPIIKPYANQALNVCEQCEQEGAMFNLGTRSCFYCGGLSYLNESTSLCEQCPKGQFYNLTLKKCQKCPPGLFLNTSSQKCEQCDSREGEYADEATGSCMTCPAGLAFNESQKQCQECNLTAAQFLNQTTHKCQHCPPTSFYDLNSRKCELCGLNEFFDQNAGICQACPHQQVFDPSTLQCQTCQGNAYFNSTLKQCTACPSDTVFNQSLSMCVCPSDRPAFNNALQVCEHCPVSQTWDSHFQRCVNYNNIGFCPPSKPYYNTTLQVCEECSAGTSFNHNTFQCDPVRRHQLAF